MRKDVIIDRYARLYEIPYELARLGHAVIGLCLNYHGRAPTITSRHDAGGGTLEWHSNDLGRGLLPGLMAHVREVRTTIATFRPDIVIGASDALHAALGRRVARAAGLPYAVDLYDNFESFGLTRVPGLRSAYRRAVREANLVTCVSDPLHRHVVDVMRATPEAAMTLESTINETLFHPHERAASRATLGLPQHLKLIGTAGALDASRNTATLYEAWRQLKPAHPELGLVLAGPRDKATPLPTGADVFYLGELEHARVAALFSALDVAVICMKDDAFGRYAFPQKAYEIIACGTPLVAARVGAIAALLDGQAGCLFDGDDSASLFEAIEHQLRAPTPAAVRVPTWGEQAERMAARIAERVDAYNRSR